MSLLDAIVRATGWIAVAAMVITTIYLFWSGFAERVLTVRYACGALVISAAFAAAWRCWDAAGGTSTAILVDLALG